VRRVQERPHPRRVELLAGEAEIGADVAAGSVIEDVAAATAVLPGDHPARLGGIGG